MTACSDPATNRAAAIALVGENGYAPVAVVIVDTVAPTIHFRVGGGGSTIFTATWGDLDHMWTPCPSTLPSQATTTNLTGATTIGASGTLYLNGAYIGSNKISAPEPKWPTRLAKPTECKPLSVVPTSIVISGTEMADDNLFYGSIDLMDPDLALSAQTIDNTGGPITLQLTAQGFERFHVGFGGGNALDTALATIQAKQDPIAIARAWNIIAEVAKLLRPPPPKPPGPPGPPGPAGPTIQLRPDQRASLLTLLPGGLPGL